MSDRRVQLWPGSLAGQLIALLLIALLCCGDGSLHGGGVGQIVVRAGVR